MARGWESKSVEAQQEEASRAELRRRAATPEQLALADRRRTLELMRKRAGDDLSRATAPAHRHMLEEAIASLDSELAGLRTSER
jgi:RNA polymerase-interacting CarD/CdnL/TRCF family regulator